MSLEQIVDIQIINNRIIEIKEVSFDVKSIEKGIQRMPYRGQGLTKDVQVEEARLPSIAKVFYECIFSQSIPSAERLHQEYMKKYFDNVGNGLYRLKQNGVIYSGEGVRARVFRAFPSLLRDFHFYVLCQSSHKFDKVEYSFLTDTQQGIDLIITYKGLKFAISLFVNTNRSMNYKQKKYHRHDYSDVREICLPINPFDKTNYVGDYALYNMTHVEEMVRQMEEKILMDEQVCH